MTIPPPCLVQRNAAGTPLWAISLRPVLVATSGGVWNRRVERWRKTAIEVSQ